MYQIILIQHKMKKSLLILFTIASSVAYAQFNLSGEFRPRTEYSHGYKALAGDGQKESIFTSQRTRLNFNYASEKYKAKLVLQDVRTWGNQAQLVSNEDFAASIHEAWVDVMLKKNISLKAGRMELIYDDHRIFGSVGWAQQARSHDLALLKYEGKIKAHVGFAYNENTARTNNFYDGPNAYKAMQYIWLNKKTDNLNLSFLFLNNGKAHTDEIDTATMAITKQSTQYSQTVGPRIVYKKDKLTVGGNMYYQTGEDGNDNNLNAYEVALDINYKASEKLSFGVGYELLSGTSQIDTANTENNSFTPFFGTNHKFNGFMDYFYVGNHSNNVGLQDIYLKGKYAKDKLVLNAHVHLFSAAADVADPADVTKALNPSLGTEIDLAAVYKVSKEVKFVVGYSHLLATSTMEALKGGDKDELNNWAYLMLVVKPEFIKAAKK
jgi:hypothetical protein